MNLLRNDSAIIEPPKTFNAERQKWTDARRQEWTNEYRAERHEPPALSLGERGLIQDCNKSLVMLFGLRRSDLVWQPVSKLLPQLVDVELIQGGQVNPFFNYLCRCGQLYQSWNRQGEAFFSNLSIVRLEYEGRRSFRMIVRPT